MAVDRAQCAQDGSFVGKGSGGAIANDFDRDRISGEGLAQTRFGDLELIGVGGSEIEQGRGGLWNGVDAGATRDLANVEGGAGAVRQRDGGEGGERLGYQQNRVRDAGVGPGMAPRT